ncbi:PE-PPE domain-containing protein [Mycolicibacterium chlorophenolicum]|uniref:Putative PPE family protein PPE42 n=1 Tax=Mycolicibacterium chlorophenolicum TaxID=37916 RepID=A0A0J6WG09_9MYCO|nr:PE-PPE domain-containing protein [Mycolicibacterium chlorophenolicum]KMO82200.1 putative PPE family protein PPE42 [Mycolicibacterium chlorophenolicum]
MSGTAKRLTNPRRRLALLAAAATAVPLVAGMPALATAPEAAAALKPIVTLALYPGRNTDDHGGIMCTGARTCQPVSYPYLERSVGAEDLQSALTLDTSGGQVVVFGYSQGARVVSQWLEEYGDAPGARTPAQLSVVLIGNPDRKFGGAHVHLGQVTPETQYDIIDVSREYDMASDWPDRPLNLLALANAYAGMRYIHIDYENVDIYDPGNYVWKEGNTTYVFVPTENIPLLEPLRRLGLDALADKLNDPLKAKIDKAYDRSYLPATPGWPPELLPKTDPPQQDPTPTEPTTLTAARTVRTSSKAADDDTATSRPVAEVDDAATEDTAADPRTDADPADDTTADSVDSVDSAADDTDDSDATAPAPAASGADDSGKGRAASDKPARTRPFGGRLLGRHAHQTANADSPSAAS